MSQLVKNQRGIQVQETVYSIVYTLFSEVCSNHISILVRVTPLPGEANIIACSYVSGRNGSLIVVSRPVTMPSPGNLLGMQVLTLPPQTN